MTCDLVVVGVSLLVFLEILKSLFVFADKEKNGHITQGQFVNLLNVVNPFDKKRARRALKELTLQSDKIMNFGEFKRMNDIFPGMLAVISLF